jgi:hypothetical protein
MYGVGGSKDGAWLFDVGGSSQWSACSNHRVHCQCRWIFVRDSNQNERTPWIAMRVLHPWCGDDHQGIDGREQRARLE